MKMAVLVSQPDIPDTLNADFHGSTGEIRVGACRPGSQRRPPACVAPIYLRESWPWREKSIDSARIRAASPGA
jgi:hypothetical protein